MLYFNICEKKLQGGEFPSTFGGKVGASFSRTEAWSLVKLSKDMSGKPVVSTPSFKPLKSRKMRFGQGCNELLVSSQGQELVIELQQ